MSKFLEWLAEWLPTVWAITGITIITFGGIALAINLIKCVLSLLGVL